MLTIILWVLALIAVAIFAILAYASTRPNELVVRREAAMAAPPERIFPLIEDFQRWGAWSPWEKRDPALKRTYEGPARGKGSIYAWEGNRNVGSGRMEILEATPSSRVIIKLDFIKPFEGHNVAEFSIDPQRASTQPSTHVTWTMRGKTPLIGKVMGIFMDMDKMIGRDFEAGLASMKAAAEA